MQWNIYQLDMRTFAQAQASLSADETLTRFERLRQEVCLAPGQQETDLTVHWQVQSQLRPSAKNKAQSDVWLHLSVQATLPLTCQRCLNPVETPLTVDRWFRFVDNEAAAMAQDDDCDEDLLVLDPRPNLLELVEDELLLALPLVPKHETCPVPVITQAGHGALAEQTQARKNPFAELAHLKSIQNLTH